MLLTVSALLLLLHTSHSPLIAPYLTFSSYCSIPHILLLLLHTSHSPLIAPYLTFSSYCSIPHILLLLLHTSHSPLSFSALASLLFSFNSIPKLVFFLYHQTLLVQVWYPMTVATNSRAQKQIIAQVSPTVCLDCSLLFVLSTSFDSSNLSYCYHPIFHSI